MKPYLSKFIFLLIVLSSFALAQNNDLESLKARVKKNDASAQNILADRYLTGNGVEKNPEKAIFLLKKSAAQDYSQAQHNLGVYYENGYAGLKKDINKAIFYYEKSAAQNNSASLEILGNYYLKLIDNKAVKVDLAKGFSLIKKSAELGLDNSMHTLAWCYYHGKGVESDKNLAIKWYKKAAKQGIANAQHSLGVMYFKGDGMKQDYNTARAWFEKAAKQKHVGSEYNLGMIYLRGHGVPKNIETAKIWIRRAAKQGDTLAAENLKRIESGIAK